MFRLAFLASIFLALFVLCGCREQPLPPGTVASVNGELINLHALQALLDSRSAALGIPRRPSVADMRERYRYALSILIAHALVRQELAKLGIEIDEKDVDEAIEQIKEDFGADNLEEYFTEAFLREEEWRQLMRDQLSVRAFTERVLAPAARVSLAEIKQYYNDHRESFMMPRAIRICHAQAAEKEELEAWCRAENSDEFERSPLSRCMDTRPETVGEPWAKELKKLAPGKCGRIIEQDGQWRALALARRYEEGARQLSEVYALIESLLQEEKKLTAFNKWLEQKLAQSRILASPGLFSAKAD